MDTYDLVGHLKENHGIDDPDNEDALTNVQCLKWINMARRKIQREIKLRFSEFEDTDVLAASGRTVALPTGFIAFYSLYYIDDDGNYKQVAWFNSKKLFDQRFPDRTLEGTLIAATQWGTNMILGLIPSASVTLYRSGLKLVPDLAYGVGETDAFLDACWEAILWMALIISGEHATVPADKHMEWKQFAASELTVLRKNYKVAKVRPNRIISNDIGTVITTFEE